jgi:hypothetical protein
MHESALAQSRHPDRLAMALAHTVSDKVEAAYRRTDLFERRRRLMQQWATFCATAPAQERQSNITPLRAS